MKFSAYVVSVFAAAGLTRAGTVPTQPGPNTFIKITYADDTLQYFDFGVCLPYEVNGSPIAEAFVLQSAICYPNEKLDCSGYTTLPIGIPFPKGTSLINVADFVQLIGQAAKCYKSPSSEIPLAL